MKILYTASTDIHLRNFHLPYLAWFKQQGFEVHVACNSERAIPFADKSFTIPFSRSPFSKRNAHSFRLLKNIVDNDEYALVHCHTPSCAVVTRLATRKARKNGTKVLYTAHGFHFYRGSSLLSWLLLFPVELAMAYLTDGIITLNEEDYRLIQSPLFPRIGKFRTNGIGINPQRLATLTKEEVHERRTALGIGPSDTVILYIAEFIPRKNHLFFFKAIKSILRKAPNCIFMFAGGPATEQEKMIAIAQSEGFIDRIRILGYQEDIGAYISISDIGVSTSKAEGLPIGIAELMFNNIPVVVSSIRGHIDLVSSESGFLFPLDDPDDFSHKLIMLCCDRALRARMGASAKRTAEMYLIDPVLHQTVDIYRRFLLLSP